MLVAHACNPSYLGGWQHKDQGWGQSRQTVWETAISKITRAKWTEMWLKCEALSSKPSPTKNKKTQKQKEGGGCMAQVVEHLPRNARLWVQTPVQTNEYSEPRNKSMCGQVVFNKVTKTPTNIWKFTQCWVGRLRPVIPVLGKLRQIVSSGPAWTVLKKKINSRLGVQLHSRVLALHAQGPGSILSTARQKLI
jgi:hypothetical protein